MDEAPGTLLRSEVVYEGRVLSVHRDRVRLPNGQRGAAGGGAPRAGRSSSCRCPTPATSSWSGSTATRSTGGCGSCRPAASSPARTGGGGRARVRGGNRPRPRARRAPRELLPHAGLLRRDHALLPPHRPPRAGRRRDTRMPDEDEDIEVRSFTLEEAARDGAPRRDRGPEDGGGGDAASRPSAVSAPVDPSRCQCRHA